VPDGTPPADNFAVYRASSVPGGRAPHAWLDDRHDIGASRYDRLGTGFTLLRLGPLAPKEHRIVAAAESRGVPVTVLAIEDPEIRDIYGCDLALIRPDQHVAWRGNADPGDPQSLWARITGH